MSIYRIRARSHTHPRLGNAGLSVEEICWALPKATVVELSNSEPPFVTLELHLEPEAGLPELNAHLATVNEIIGALQRLGYSTLNATVGELVDRSVEAAVGGALTTTAGTRVVTKNPLALILAALAGAIAATWVESQLRRFEVTYQLVPARSGWVLTPISAATT